ncbi:26S proteasome non-ATPase regulatory subunit 4 homolog [Rutidosis leptorrhynchoides]|uniref:26S proteasome non-ATPase regulatory subunit 4 homolog n=1 Tax=Rutidosis leptorrhynchoides TaxID=125765 RepID=UPI003A99E7C1
MEAPEAIMICIDSSQWMNRLDRFYWYTLQLNCVRSYCVAKFKSNPKNAIGILKMGTRSERQKNIRPTSDLDQILDFLENNRVSGGGLSFFCGLQNCWYILQQLYPRNQKRILMFTGGYVFVDFA